MHNCSALQEAAAKEWPQRRQATFKPLKIPSKVTTLLQTLQLCHCDDSEAPTSCSTKHQCFSSLCRT